MILGRSTPQWIGLITAATSTLQVLIVALLPTVDPVQVAIIIGSVTGFLGVFVAFLAKTETTPTKDPELKEGTMIRVTDQGGTIIGHELVPTPGTPGPGTPGGAG